MHTCWSERIKKKKKTQRKYLQLGFRTKIAVSVKKIRNHGYWGLV